MLHFLFFIEKRNQRQSSYLLFVVRPNQSLKLTRKARVRNSFFAMAIRRSVHFESHVACSLAPAVRPPIYGINMNRTFLLIIAFVFWNCKTSTTSPTSENPSIVPLKIGNEWIMQTTYYDTLGNVGSTVQESIKVIGDTTIQGQKYFKVLDGYALILCRNRADGFCLKSWNDPSEYLAVKYPSSVGDSYSYLTINVMVLSTDTIISVPNGDIHCCHYSLSRSAAPTFPLNHFYAPSVGFVQREVAFNDRPMIAIRSKLVSYIIK